MSKKVLEIVIWKSKPEFTESDIIERSKNLNEFVNGQKGFVSRDFAKNDEGQWVDFLYWDTLENAQNAAKNLETSPLCGAFFETIDMSSMQMFHFSSLYQHIAS
jgi:hypothetical protein